MSVPVETVGSFPCHCCCGSEREYNTANCDLGYMRCTGCGCSRARMGPGLVTLRVQVVGVINLTLLEQCAELARALGAPDDTVLTTDGRVHYLELSAEGAANSLEIQRLRGISRPRLTR